METPLLAVDMVPKTDPPSVSEMLTPWVGEPFDDFDREPKLRDAIYVGDDFQSGVKKIADPDDEPGNERPQQAVDVPGLADAFDDGFDAAAQTFEGAPEHCD